MVHVLSRWCALPLRLAAAALLVLSVAASPARAQAPPDVPPPAPILGVEGDHFTVDGKPTFLTLLSYFDGLRIANDLELRDDLLFIKATLGFDGVRIFPNWWVYDPAAGTCPQAANDTLFAADGTLRGDGPGNTISGRLLALIRFLRAAEDTGLVVDLSFARETVPGGMSVDAYRAALQRTAFLLREYRLVLFDIQNERDSSNAAQRLTPEQTLAIRNAIKDPVSGDAYRIVTASMGGTPYSVANPGDPATAVGFAAAANLDVNAHHDARGANWSTNTTTVVTQLRNGGKPVYLQEPTRWRMATNACGGVENTEQSDGNSESFRTALRLAKAARAAAWTLHTQRAFRLNGPNGRLRTQLEALPSTHPERELLMGVGSIQKLTTSDDATPWPITVPLTLQVSGPGTVRSEPIAGATCAGTTPCVLLCTGAGGTCAVDAPLGATIILNAMPDAATPGSPIPRFDAWDVLTDGGESPCPFATACTFALDLPRDVGARFGLTPVESVELYHTDAIGSVRAVSTLGSTQVRRYDYQPFGELWSASEPSNQLKSTRLFAGKERDAETLYDYFGARYLRGPSGRFTTVDPVLDAKAALVDPQRWARYPYARNNPFRYVDPDGRAFDVVVDVVSIAYDVYDIGRTWWKGESSTSTQWLALGGDVVGAVVPGLTGVGVGVRAGAHADEAVHAVRAVSSGRKPTVIGHFDGNKTLANNIGGRFMNVPDPVWARMSDTERWIANKKFLNNAVKRREVILLSTLESEVRSPSILREEIRYLKKRGYTFSADGTRMLPPAQ